MAFFPCILDWVTDQAPTLNLYPESCTFKLKDGSIPVGGGPFDCRVGRHMGTATEQAAGGRTTEFGMYDVFFPAGTDVQPTWRANITFEGAASAIEYFVRDAGSPTTNELERRVVVERVR